MPESSITTNRILLGNRLSPWQSRLSVIGVLLVVWEILAAFFGDPMFVARPFAIMARIARLLGQMEIWRIVGFAVFEIFIAFAISVVIGVTIGLTVGLNRTLRNSIYPVITLIYAVPQAPFLPLFTLVFGIGPEAKVAYGFTHGVFVVILAVVAGVQRIDQKLIVAARSMGAARNDIFTTVILPSMLPALFNGMRLAMTSVILGVLLAELYISTGGLGSLVQRYTFSFDPTSLMALILIVALTAITFNETVRRLELKASAWRS